MASKTARPVGGRITISMSNAKTSIYCLELSFKARKITEDWERLFEAINCFDDEVTDWFYKQTEKPDTFRKFKQRLLKYITTKLPRTIMENRQSQGEETSTWLKRIIPLMWEYEMEMEEAKFWLISTAIDFPSRKLIFRSIYSVNTYAEMEEGINFIEEEERVRKNIEFIEHREELKRLNPHQTTENQNNTQKNHNSPIYKRRTQLQKENTQIKVNQILLKREKIENGTTKINGAAAQVCLDTGSGANIISTEEAKERGCFKSKINTKTLRNVFGKIIDIDEETIATIEMDGVRVTVPFLVAPMEDSTGIIIGKETIAEIELKRRELQEIKGKYNLLCSQTPSPGYEEVQCEINTKIGKRVNIKYKNIPQAQMEMCKIAIDELISNGYIEPSSSSWANPLRPVPKGDKVRITCAMQFLNNLVEDDNYTVPKIQQILNSTQGKKCFTIIDMKDGYYQIKLKQEDRHKTAFHFQNKLYQWTRMPQGFKNSPAIFQRVMDRVLSEYIGKICEVYLDDIVVFGINEAEHDRNLDTILQTLQNNNFRINCDKLQYKGRIVKLLGATIDGETQSPIAEKQKKIFEYKTPQNRKEVEKFLGFVSYYRRFIPNMATIAAPLYNLLKGNKTETIVWKNEDNEAFEKLKDIVSRNLITYLPDSEKKFILTTDASDTGLGAVLQQESPDGLRPIDWASKKLTDTEKKFGITERELLAMFWGIQHFDYYLRGRKFTVITDHTALKAVKTKAIMGNARLERMRMKLQEYDFDIIYKKGSEIIEADAISRLHEETPEFTDHELKSKNLLANSADEHFWQMDDGTLRHIPKMENRIQLIQQIHADRLNHRGREATEYELTKTHYWPSYRRDIKSAIENCAICQKNHQKPAGGEKFIATEYPNQIAGVDLMFLTQQQPILIYVDYFTRLSRAKTLKSKEPTEIKEQLQAIVAEIGTPSILVSDNGKEFTANLIKTWLAENNIEHHRIPAEKHQANGRVERLNRTLWQYFRKANEEGRITEETLAEVAQDIISKYNDTKHRALNMTPNEAWEDPTNPSLITENSTTGIYSKEFREGRREKFKKEDNVWVKTTAVEAQSKITSIYSQKGQIIEICPNDSYLVRLAETDKITKKSHSQLKKLL